jgi:protease-4
MDTIKNLADGRPYTAKQALDSGLIDAIAYLPETIERMKADLNLADALVVVYGTPGEYSGSVYSSGKEASSGRLDALNGMNLSAVGNESLFEMGGPEFMYIWMGR